MKTINIPGFTAEASVYKSIDSYGMVVRGGTVTNRSTVEPQTIYCEPCRNGRQECYGDISRCFHFCYRPLESFVPICNDYCIEGEFRTWSQPCGGIRRPPE